ncbi:hypothetical protein E2562_001995 [Oryza meyeriana var. granulata]|uniref:Uncharacterized protein n=1 Tax=Oryza meyeriana var. granulata TaxID=110450 RepID=A0A6G1C416_9ORYZ|nr:hypothetical protein E2562_001995 [Oryza meyeriana var. granulata]
MASLPAVAGGGEATPVADAMAPRPMRRPTLPLPLADEVRHRLPTVAGDGGARHRRSSTARRNRSASSRSLPPSNSICSSQPPPLPDADAVESHRITTLFAAAVVDPSIMLHPHNLLSSPSPHSQHTRVTSASGGHTNTPPGVTPRTDPELGNNAAQLLLIQRRRQ